MDMQSKAKKLIEMIQTAPVEWKPLGEIGLIYGGLTGKNKYDFENGNSKYVTYKNIFDNIEVDLNNLGTVRVNTGEKQHCIKYGDILFTGSSETADEAGMSSVVTSKFDEMIFLNSFSFGFRFNENIIIPEFAKYLFRSYFIRKEIIKTASGVTRFNISKERFKKIKIPIPPLETQQKIVKILDKFTELEATLEAELALRKRQYRYYRNFLLDFDNQIGGGIADSYKGRLKDVVWKMLGEVSDIKVGKSPETNEIGNYPFINAGTIPSGYIASYNTEPDTITTPSRGQGGIGYVGYQASKFWCGPLCYRVRSNNNLIMTKFLYYVMSKDMSKIINLANMAGIPALNKKDLVNFLIPIPPLAEQEKIVAILDKFDTLTHSISEGLPHEIALRRKQYEYYREQLLAFPKAA